MKEEIYGLSIQEVKEKRRKGEGEHEPESITKSKNQIIRENVLTLFNLLNFIIAGLLFAVGAYTNMIFIAIIILNIVIGIAQEFKAKKLVDELSILNRPSIKGRRGGEDRNIEQKDIVKGDTVILESGSQICNDSIVTQGMLEVNESLLTGESDPVIKEPGNTLYSGSSVISGKAYAEVIHVGNDNYATNLVNEVKKEKKVQSELLGSMRKVTRFTSTLIIPLGIILFLEAFIFRKAPANESVVASAAALLGMLPKGLVLLISVSLATGVIRLAKMKILVQILSGHLSGFLEHFRKVWNVNWNMEEGWWQSDIMTENGKMRNIYRHRSSHYTVWCLRIRSAAMQKRHWNSSTDRE